MLKKFEFQEKCALKGCKVNTCTRVVRKVRGQSSLCMTYVLLNDYPLKISIQKII